MLILKVQTQEDKYKVLLKGITGSLIWELIEEYQYDLPKEQLMKLGKLPFRKWIRTAELVGKDKDGLYSLIDIANKILSQKRSWIR